MTAPILVLTGPPGVGKTTVARLVAAAFDLSAHVEGDRFFRFIHSGFVDPSTPQSQVQNEHVIDITTQAVLGYAAAGYTTVLDGIFGPWFMPRISEIVHASGADLHYVVLLDELEACVARFVAREGSDERESMVRQLHGSLTDLDRDAPHVLQVQGTPDEAAAEALQRFHAGSLLVR